MCICRSRAESVLCLVRFCLGFCIRYLMWAYVGHTRVRAQANCNNNKKTNKRVHREIHWNVLCQSSLQITHMRYMLTKTRMAIWRTNAHWLVRTNFEFDCIWTPPPPSGQDSRPSPQCLVSAPTRARVFYTCFVRLRTQLVVCSIKSGFDNISEIWISARCGVSKHGAMTRFSSLTAANTNANIKASVGVGLIEELSGIRRWATWTSSSEFGHRVSINMNSANEIRCLYHMNNHSDESAQLSIWFWFFMFSHKLRLYVFYNKIGYRIASQTTC